MMEEAKFKLIKKTSVLYTALLIFIMIISFWIKKYPANALFFKDLRYFLIIKAALLFCGIYLYSELKKNGKSISLSNNFNIRQISFWFTLTFLFVLVTLYGKKQIPEFPVFVKSLPTAILLSLFCAAIPEELFFRAGIQQVFDGANWKPVIIQAALFALYHVPSRIILSPDDVYKDFFGTFVFGISAGYLWWKYKSLALVIAIHTAWDTPFLAR